MRLSKYEKETIILTSEGWRSILKNIRSLQSWSDGLRREA